MDDLIKDGLIPEVATKAEALSALCQARGWRLRIYCTYRSNEEQDAIYAISRTKPGKKVTDARGGQSWHNHKKAFDAVLIVDGRAVWGKTKQDWELLGALGGLAESVGLEWGGRWLSRDGCHFQLAGLPENPKQEN